jgi:signal transduction histidine kinase
MLTGDMDDQLLSKCFEYGSTDFLYKPIKGLVLNARVKSALATSEYIKQINSQKKTLETQTKKLQDSLEQLCLTQDQLVESEKMAALGGLVAGVAHEINTPVGVGVTAASHLDMKVQEYKDRYHAGQLTRGDFEVFLQTVQGGSEMILSNLCRAAELIRSFKQIAVDQSNEERRVFRVRAYVDDVLQSLAPKLKRTQYIITVHCPTKLEMWSYPGAFSHIITNFLMNSLNHGFENQEKGEIVIDISQQKGKILFEYSDNGKGIEPEHLKKIFEPFFTTKRGQGGTGLGLHIVFSLVTQTLGGHIECSSTPGQGTTFLLLLPDKKVAC